MAIEDQMNPFAISGVKTEPNLDSGLITRQDGFELGDYVPFELLNFYISEFINKTNHLLKRSFNDYAASTTYEVDDVVLYNGDTYRSLTGTNQGNTPDSSTSNWRLLAGHYDARDMFNSIHGRAQAAVESVLSAQNTYVVSAGSGQLSPTTLFNGLRITFVTDSVNTGASTLNAYGLGSRQIVGTNGQPLTGGEMAGVNDLWYDAPNNRWVLLGISSSAVAGFSAATAVYMLDDLTITDNTFEAVNGSTTVLAEDTWHTIGPPGSGADVEIGLLGSIPSNAKFVELKVYDACSSTPDHTLSVFLRPGGSTASNTTNLRNTRVHYKQIDTQTDSVSVRSSAMTPAKVVLDANNVFEFRWTLNRTFVSGFLSLTIVAFGV